MRQHERRPLDLFDDLGHSVGLAAAGSPQQDHIVVLMDVVAGPEAEQFFLLQLPVWQILHIFQTSCRVGEGCLPDQALQMVALSCIPFCVNNKPQSILKGHAVVL